MAGLVDGTLQIGRSDNGDVVGVSGVRELLADLPNKIRDILGIQVAVNPRRKGGREFVEIEVPTCRSPISRLSSFPSLIFGKIFGKTSI